MSGFDTHLREDNSLTGREIHCGIQGGRNFGKDATTEAKFCPDYPGAESKGAAVERVKFIYCGSEPEPELASAATGV